MEQVERILAVRELMREREKARKSSNFDESDRLRNQLKDEYGVKVIDQKDGPSGWKFLDGSSNKIDPSKSNMIPKVEASTSTNSAGSKRKLANDESVSDSQSKKPALTTDSKKPKQDDSKKATPVKPVPPSKALASEAERNKQLVANVVQNQTKTTSGILIEDLQVGKGAVAQNGHRLKMLYVGRLKSNNKVFDSSTKKPFSFRLGRGEVIKGWDIGCAGMREGGKRRLTIPPEKAYGRSGAPPAIPGNATLVFEVTLLQVA